MTSRQNPTQAVRVSHARRESRDRAAPELTSWGRAIMQPLLLRAALGRPTEPTETTEEDR